MRHFFILNPSAGKGTKFHNLIDEIHKVCDRRKVYYSIHVTEKQGEASEFVKKMCESSNEPARFYACGGDGTINEVASGLIGYDHAELAVIPMGTGNDFVRNFEHTEKFFDIDAQLDSETRKIDLIKYNDKYAVNMINIGFDCEIAKQAVKNRRSVLVPSKVAYMFGVVQKVTALNTAIFEGKVIFDGKVYRGKKFQLCAFANGAFYGGGFYAAPASTLNDGVLDACVVDTISLEQLIKLIPHYKAGAHLTKIDTRNILTYRKCNKIELVFDHPTDICVDGEFEQMRGKMTLTVVPKAINLSTPKACQPIVPDPAVMKAVGTRNN